MEKKLSQSSQYKISSKSSCEKKKHQQQQQCLNSLVKALKPRVYITDSSTFKSLVQELTGNGNIINGRIPLITSSLSTPPSPPLPVIEIDDRENSADFSFDSSQVNSTFIDTFGYSPSQMIDDNGFQESNSPEYLCDYSSPVQIGNNGFKESSSRVAAFSFDSSELNVATSLEYSPPTESCWLANDIVNEETGYSQYREIESWLLEVDPTVYNSYDDSFYAPSSNIQQEVCVSDYDVSGSHMIIL